MTRPPGTAVVLLGDHDTANQIEALTQVAAHHGASVAEVFSFAPGDAARADDLSEVEPVVQALGAAITARLPIWTPYPREDLWREQHFRRLSIALQRHGLNLLFGNDLVPCPVGTSELDFALRAEVRAVDDLDRAALAAAGARTLDHEIEMALVAASDTMTAAGTPAARPPARPPRTAPRTRRCTDDTGPGALGDSGPAPPPRLPSPDAPWAHRQPILKRYARWLVETCGLTQTAAAQCLNPTGQRTPQGHLWQQATVSALIKGKYDRC